MLLTIMLSSSGAYKRAGPLGSLEEGAVKKVVIELDVPDWLDEAILRKLVEGYVASLVHKSAYTADELRAILGVEELKESIEVPEGLEEELKRLRKGRIWRS